jgi:energy-converting hydrogenase Eha subunit F
MSYCVFILCQSGTFIIIIIIIISGNLNPEQIYSPENPILPVASTNPLSKYEYMEP